MAVISLKIKADARAAEKTMNSFTANTEKATSRIEKLSNELKDTSILNYSKGLQKISKSSMILGDATGGLIKQKRFLAKEITKLSNKGIPATDKRIVALRNEYVKINAQTKNLSQSTKKLNLNFGGLAKATVAIGAGIATVRGIGMAFSSSFNAADDFVRSVKNVTTITNDLNFAQIQEGLLSLPAALGGAKQLADGLYQTISAGISTAHSFDVLTASAKFAKGGLTDINTAVDATTTVLNSYGLSSTQASKVTDVFTSTVKQGKITAGELAVNLGKVVPIAAQMGISIEEVNAGFAALTLVGNSAEESATQLKGVFAAFLKPSEKMKEALKEQGFATGEAAVKTLGMKGALKFLETATNGSKAAFAELIPNIRGLQGAVALTSNDSEAFTRILGEMENAAGATEEAFKRQIDPIEEMNEEFDRFKVKLGLLTRGMITAAAPAIIEFTKSLAPIIDTIKKLDFGAMAVGVGSMTLAFIGAKIAVAAFSLSMTGLKIALIKSGIGALVVGLGYAAYKLTELTNKTREFNDILELPENKAEKERLKLLGEQLEKVKELEVQEAKKLKKIDYWKQTEAFEKQNRVLGKAGLERYELEKKIAKTKEDILKKGGEATSFQEQMNTLMEQFNLSAEEAKKKIKQIISTPSTDEDAIKKRAKELEELKERYEKIPIFKLKLETGESIESVQALENRLLGVNKALGYTSDIIRSDIGASSQLFQSMITGTDNVINAVRGLNEEFASNKEQFIFIAGEIASTISNLFDGISAVIGENMKNEIKVIDNTSKRKKEKIKEDAAAGIITEEEKNTKIQELEKETASKKHEMEVAAFNTQKGFSIASALIDMSAAIMKMWATTIDPTFITQGVMTGVIGAIGAAQVGLIAAQKPPPPPQFATGTGKEGFQVPAGFANDDFMIGARTGERVTVETDEEQEEGRMMYLTINVGGTTLRKEIQNLFDTGQVVVSV